MPRLAIASVIAGVLVLIGLGLFTLLLPNDSGADLSEVTKLVSLKSAVEDCQLIQAKVEKLRKIPSGGNCRGYGDCAIVSQSCSSVPKAEAQKYNAEFDRLLDKARDLNCDVGYLICEFVASSCRGNSCVVERANFNEPEVPKQ